MTERDASLQVSVDGRGAVSGAKKVEDSLKLIADAADKAVASINALNKLKVSTPTAGGRGAAQTGAAPRSTGGGAGSDFGLSKTVAKVSQALTGAVQSAQAFTKAANRAAEAAGKAATALRTIKPQAQAPASPARPGPAAPAQTPRPAAPTAPVSAAAPRAPVTGGPATAPAPVVPPRGSEQLQRIRSQVDDLNRAISTMASPKIDIGSVERQARSVGKEFDKLASKDLTRLADNGAAAINKILEKVRELNRQLDEIRIAGVRTSNLLSGAAPGPVTARQARTADNDRRATSESMSERAPGFVGPLSQRANAADVAAATKAENDRAKTLRANAATFTQIWDQSEREQRAHHRRMAAEKAESDRKAMAAERTRRATMESLSERAPSFVGPLSPKANAEDRAASLQADAIRRAQMASPSSAAHVGPLPEGAAESRRRLANEATEFARAQEAASRQRIMDFGKVSPGQQGGTGGDAGAGALAASTSAAAATIGTASAGTSSAFASAGIAATKLAEAAQKAAENMRSPRSGADIKQGFGKVSPGLQMDNGPRANPALSTKNNLSQPFQQAENAAKKAATSMQKAMEKSHDAISSLTDRVLSLRTAFVALGAGVALRSLAETGMKFESIGVSMNIVTGDAKLAKEELARLREETDRLGIRTLTAADDYVKFLAAIKGSSVDANMAKDAFFGVSQAMSILGKSEEQTSRALKAIEQIASKGQVYAEELKGQLGDQLPGAINMAANAMGYTVERMFKEMEKGNISAEKFFATFNKEIQLNFPLDRAQTARAAVNRLTNAWDDFQKMMNDSGFLDAWADSAENLAKKLNSIEGKVLAQELGEMLGNAVRATANAMIFLADNADIVKKVLIAIIGLQAIGWFLGIASAISKAATAMGIFNAVLMASPMGRMARIVGLVGGALGLGALAAQAFGEDVEDTSKEIQGAENAYNSYLEKIKGGTKITDDAAASQRELAIEMTKTALAAEQAKLDTMQGQRKELLEITAGEKPPEWKEQAMESTLDTGPMGTFKGDEVAMEFNKIGIAADDVAGRVKKLKADLASLQDDAAIAEKQKPKPPKPNRKLEGTNPGDGGSKKRSTESYFEEQKAELDAQIDAERKITAAYNEGTAAVEKQREELEILRKVQKLKFEFNPKQVAELEKRIRALAEAQEGTKIRADVSDIDDQKAKIENLALAREQGTEAMLIQGAQEEAVAKARQNGYEANILAVNNLTNAYASLARKKEEDANKEATADFGKEIENIDKLIAALDLEGIARTRRIAELQEEAEMIKNNMAVDTAAAQARIKAAGDVAAAGSGQKTREDLKTGDREINTINAQMGAMGALGEQRIRQMAEIERTAELQARGADMADKHTQALIRQAGEVAVLSDRFARQNDALDDLANSGMTFNEQMRQISYDGLGSMEDALVDLITGTKSVKEAFADMAKSIAQDLARMAVRQAITVPLAGLLTGALGGGMGAAPAFGGFTSEAALGGITWLHSGGIAGTDSRFAGTAPASLFKHAPRYHSGKPPSKPGSLPSAMPGLGGGEVAAILKKEEGVFTPAQMQALGPAGGTNTMVLSPTINVQQPQGATQEQGQAFGKGIVRELQGMVDERIQRAFKPGGLRNQ